MKKIFILPIFFIALGSIAAEAFSIADIRIISVSPAEKFAVVRFGGQQTRIIRQGDELIEQLRILEISENKIICENSSDTHKEKIVIRLENGTQKIERVRKQIEKKPVFYRPYTTQGTQTKVGGQ